ncbi:MAG: hypothetical protein U9Q82_10990 [Chloroflexota bacterium]|nr:hypothetical protein [Chloroflexota bacterium]
MQTLNSLTPNIPEHLLTLLDSYQIEFVALDSQDDQSLICFFRGRREWHLDFEDDEAIVFVREAIT